MDYDQVKIDKLVTSEQWPTWKFQIKIILNANNILEVVTGEQEEKDEEFAKKLNLWLLKERKAQKIIATTVGQQPLIHIMNCSTSKEMWEKLLAVYEQKSQANIHILQQKFYSFKRNSQDDIATHIAKLETIVQQLKEAGENISDSMVMTKILMTLPSSYNHFFSAWESTAAENKTLANLTSRLILEETHLRWCKQTTSSSIVQSLEQEQSALAAAKLNKNKFQKTNNKKGKCFLCKETGHWRKECPNKKKNYSNTVNFAKTSDDIDAFVCETFYSEKTKPVDSDDWILDSGASHHMSFRREWFENFVFFSETMPVVVGNGEKIFATGKGDITILAFDGNTWSKKCLIDVYFVPKIKINLFSSGTALDKNYKMISDYEKCEIIKDDRIIAVGVRYRRLYKMMFRVISGTNTFGSTNLAVKVEPLSLWHERFGHVCKKQVKSVLDNHNIKYMDDKDFFCESCVYGKQHRNPFTKSNSKASAAGELVHTDLCGPMQNDSLGGSKYFVLFKDDYSHFKYVYFIREKSEFSTVLEHFLFSVKTDANHEIKMIRSDNGLEYKNKDVASILKNHNIRHQTTVPYTPEQNGRAERDMRSIVETARTLLHSKNLPIKLWAEAVNTAVFLLNRFGTSPHEGKSPYELWFKKKPPVDNLKIFGTEVYVHIPKEKRRKFDKKSKKGFFVGYPENQKGYRIWIAGTKTIEVSRDVVFKQSDQNSVVSIQTDFNSDENSFENSKTKEEEISLDENGSDNDSVFESAEDHDNTADGLKVQKNQGNFQDNIFQKYPKDDQNEDDEEKTNTQMGRKNCMDQKFQMDYPSKTSEPEEPYKHRLRSHKKTSTLQPATMISKILEEHAFVTQCFEPKSYKEAVESSDAVKWKRAMDEEIEALMKNNTWDLVSLPANREVIDNKWVFKAKLTSTNRIERYKARFVVRGFTQKEGIHVE